MVDQYEIDKPPKVLKDWEKYREPIVEEIPLGFAWLFSYWAVISLNIVTACISIKDMLLTVNGYNAISHFTMISTFVGSIGALALIHVYILGRK